MQNVGSWFERNRGWLALKIVPSVQPSPPLQGQHATTAKDLTHVVSLKSEVYLEPGRILSNSLYLLDEFVRYHPTKFRRSRAAPSRTP